MSNCLPFVIGIPVIPSGFSSSLRVIIAITSSDKILQNIESVVNSLVTVVILKGMHKLSEIISISKANCKWGFPIAVIQDGIKNEGKSGIGTIGTIE